MKGNKLFVKSMIITAVIGLTTLMITMFIGVRWFLDDVVPAEKVSEKTPIEKPQVPFNSTILGVVKSIEGDEIEVFDIEKKQNIHAVIETVTQVKDAYDKIMPRAMLQVGDIVQLVYEPKEDRLLSISEYLQAWTKTDMKTAKLDRSNRSIMIGQNAYKYNDNTVIFNAEGEALSIYEVGDYDVLELKGIDDDVYSIQVLAEQGYLEVKNLPMNEGVIEIDINRQIPIGSITTPIPLARGEHKIVLSIPGYEALKTEVMIKSKETKVLDLLDLEKSHSNLTVQVLNTGVQYEVKVGDLSYRAGEPIQLPIGSYPVEIRAEGYRTWAQTINLTEPNMSLQVTLEPMVQTGDSNTTGDNNTISDTGSSNQNQADNSYSVNISTEPAGAAVYINGEHKGTTPYKANLQLGEYTVTLEKEGYETYQTSIILDNSDTQNSYLYMLIPKND